MVLAVQGHLDPDQFPYSQHHYPYTSYGTASETQGQSVGPGENARQKFTSIGGRAPGYQLSPDHFQMVKRMLAPDWAQKCFVLLCPIGEQHLLSSFGEFVHDGYYLATFARFVHQAFLIRNEGTTDESKNVWMLPAGAIQFALRKLCF